MWANPGFQSWPLQQSSFQNVPHEQVDWAALAKQWIAQRENADANAGDQAGLNHGQPPPPPPPQAEAVSLHNDLEITDGFHEQSAVSGQQQPEWGWNMEQWNQSGNQDWNAGQQAHIGNGQTFDYGHGNGSVQESYDYGHGSAGEPYQVSQPQYYSQDVQQYQQMGDSSYNQYWAEHSSPERRNYKRSYSRGRRSSDRLPENVQEDDGIDAVKRKNLPAWIREGLEKMDREKQKALEKERKIEEKQMADKSRAEAVDDQAKGQGQGVGGLAELKSKFVSKLQDSDDENAVQAHSRTPSPAPTPVKKSPPVRKRSPSPEAFKTEEEKQQDLMMRVRRMLTEVLLEVTNEEIDAVAQEVHHKERSRASKAPAQQLAKSNALASISNFGIGEESESDAEAQPEEGADSDSDTDLDERIQRRRSQYESKYGPISEDEYEEKALPKETKVKTEPGIQDKTPETPFPVQPMSESKSYHFEKQYAGIPGLDVTDDVSETDNMKQSKSDTAKRSDKTRRKSSSDKKYSKKRDHADGNKSRKKSKVTVTSSSSSSDSSSSSSSSGSSSSSSDSDSSSNESPPSSKKKAPKRTKTRHSSKGEKTKSVKSLATPDKSRYYDDDVSRKTKRSESKYASEDRRRDDRYDLDKSSRNTVRQTSRTVDDDYSKRSDTNKLVDDYDRPRSRSSSRDRQGYQDLMKRIDNYHHKAHSRSSSRDRDSHKSKSRKHRDDSGDRNYYREGGSHRSREKHREDSSYDRHSPDTRHKTSGHSSHSKRRDKEHVSSKSKRAKRSRSMSSETTSYSHRKSRRHSRSRSKESSRRKSSKSHSDKYTHRTDAERSGKKSSRKRRSRSRSR